MIICLGELGARSPVINPDPIAKSGELVDRQAGRLSCEPMAPGLAAFDGMAGVTMADEGSGRLGRYRYFYRWPGARPAELGEIARRQACRRHRHFYRGDITLLALGWLP